MKVKLFTKILLFILSLILSLSLTGCATVGELLLKGHNWGVERTYGKDYYLYEPEIKYGEFPFSVTYEMDGEIITVNDIYVCEFEGVYWGFDTGYGRRWSGYYKSKGDDYFIIKEYTTEDATVFFEITVGSAEHYMGEYGDGKAHPTICKVTQYNDGARSITWPSEEDLEQMSLKIISYELSDPIVNSFGTGKND